MQEGARGMRLAIAGYERVMEGTDMRASVLTLAAGECVPWHYHSTITDSFVCLEGLMEVEELVRRAQCTASPPGSAARWRRRPRTRCTGWMVGLQVPADAGGGGVRQRGGRLGRNSPSSKIWSMRG